MRLLYRYKRLKVYVCLVWYNTVRKLSREDLLMVTSSIFDTLVPHAQRRRMREPGLEGTKYFSSLILFSEPPMRGGH